MNDFVVLKRGLRSEVYAYRLLDEDCLLPDDDRNFFSDENGYVNSGFEGFRYRRP